MRALISILLMNLFLGLNNLVLGQNKYTLLETKDNISFYYKWKNSEFLKKDSPLMLVLKIKNLNNYTVKTSFVVDYYWNAILKASSEKQLIEQQLKHRN